MAIIADALLTGVLVVALHKSRTGYHRFVVVYWDENTAIEFRQTYTGRIQ